MKLKHQIFTIIITIILWFAIWGYIKICCGQIIDTTKVNTSLSNNQWMLYGGINDTCYIEFTLNPSKYKVSYSFLGDYYDGFPILKFEIDGNSYTFEVDTVWKTITHNISSQCSKISFIFTNDKWQAGVGDRNIYLKNIVINEIINFSDADTLLFLDEIKYWHVQFYRLDQDSCNVTINDTLTIGDTLRIFFIQPMTKKPIELQIDPIVYPIDTLITDFYVELPNTEFNGDSLKLTYIKEYDEKIFIAGKHAIQVACIDTSNNSSKYSDMGLFYVKSPMYIYFPAIPVMIEFITRKKQ